MSQTALNISVGAASRWASIMSGVWMLVILVAFSGLVGLVAIPTLAAVLIIASFSAIRPSEITTVWSSGPSAQIALVTTFVSTLFLPVAAAVGIGVALSLLLSVNAAAQDVRVTEIVRNDRGEFEERDAPSRREGRRGTILQIYGSLFYAGARTLEEELPVPDGADSPVVVIRIRARVMMGATAFSVLSKYAASLDEHVGRLYLSGVAPELMQQFAESGRVASSDPLKLKEATVVMGESTTAAYEEGRAFLVGEAPEDEVSASPRAAWVHRSARWAKNVFTNPGDE